MINVSDCYHLTVYITGDQANHRNIRHMKNDLNKYGIPYVTVNKISYDDIRDLLMVSKEGFSEICYTNQLPHGYADMTTSELINWLLDNPKALHDNILCDGTVVTNGYHNYRQSYLNRFEKLRLKGEIK